MKSEIQPLGSVEALPSVFVTLTSLTVPGGRLGVVNVMLL